LVGERVGPEVVEGVVGLAAEEEEVGGVAIVADGSVDAGWRGLSGDGELIVAPVLGGEGESEEEDAS
jgi:hypothetical protein